MKYLLLFLFSSPAMAANYFCEGEPSTAYAEPQKDKVCGLIEDPTEWFGQDPKVVDGKAVEDVLKKAQLKRALQDARDASEVKKQECLALLDAVDDATSLAKMKPILKCLVQAYRR